MRQFVTLANITRDKVENKCFVDWEFTMYFVHYASIFISTFEHHLLQWLLTSCNLSRRPNETRYGSSLFFLEKLQLSRVWHLEREKNMPIKIILARSCIYLRSLSEARLDFYASIRKICRRRYELNLRLRFFRVNKNYCSLMQVL